MTNQNRSSRLGWLDLLRVIAATSVLLFHFTFAGNFAGSENTVKFPELWDFSKYGYLGVELFFIISGFVISMSAEKSTTRDFVAARLIRIMPTLWICCTVTFAASLIAKDPHFSFGFTTYLQNLFLINGLFGNPRIDGSYWSLVYELHFYVFMAALIQFNQLNSLKIYCWGWLILSFATWLFGLGRLGTLIMADYSSFFIAGIAFYRIFIKDERSSSDKLLLIASLAGSILQATARIPRFELAFGVQFDWRIIAGIVSSFFLCFVFFLTRARDSIGDKLRLAGDLTYPLYLIHQTIGFIVFNRLNSADLTPYTSLAIVLLLISNAALFINVKLEKPTGKFLRGKYKQIKSNI